MKNRKKERHPKCFYIKQATNKPTPQSPLKNNKYRQNCPILIGLKYKHKKVTKIYKIKNKNYLIVFYCYTRLEIKHYEGTHTYTYRHRCIESSPLLLSLYSKRLPL